jgi:hypothetical protein
LVRSTWLDPSAHPAHESTTLTKTHLSGPLHTTTTVLVSSPGAYFQLTRRTFDKFEALWLGRPPLLGESAYKRSILATHPCVKCRQYSDKTCLTVGVHTGVFQQLGLLRSFPVYLVCELVNISDRLVSGTYQVMVTDVAFPFPVMLLKAFFTAPLISILFTRLLPLCEVC